MTTKPLPLSDDPLAAEIASGEAPLRMLPGDPPREIAAALFKIQTEVTRLVEDSRNEFAKYNYVSIDAYYDAIRPLMNAAGIMLIPTEREAGISPDGKTLKMTIDFDILHKDGHIWSKAIARTVFLPYTGAQSAGSALSYADKFAMRTLFKITTGEHEDEDAKEPRTPASDEADAAAPTQIRAQEPGPVDYEYSGAPYRIFNGDLSIFNSFTDVRVWGKAIKAKMKTNATPYEPNGAEISRVRADVLDQQDMTDRSKTAMIKAIDGLSEFKKEPQNGQPA